MEGRRQLNDRGVYVELEEDTVGDMIDTESTNGFTKRFRMVI